MMKFSLFLESNDKINFLKAIFANPFDITAKLVFADWLDENNKSNLAEYLRLACKYQFNKNVWEDKNDEKRYGMLGKKITRSLPKNLTYTNTTIYYNPNRRRTHVYVLTLHGLIKYDPVNYVNEKVELSELPEPILDVIVLIIGNSVGHKLGQASLVFNRNLNILSAALLITTELISMARAKNVLIVMKDINAALSHDPSVIYRTNFNFEYLSVHIETFIERLNSSSQYLHDEYGFDVENLINLLSKFRDRLPVHGG